MLTRNVVLALLLSPTLLASGCDDAKEGSKAAAADPAEKEAAKEKAADDLFGPDPSKPTRDWPEEALDTVEDEVDGIEFSLDIPAKLKREEKKNDGTFPGYVTWNGGNPFMDPSITVNVETFPPKDLDDAVKGMENESTPRKVERKQAIEGDGFMVSAIEPSKEFVIAQAWQKAGDKTITVTVMQRDEKAIPNLDELRPWMEAVAMSLKAK